MVKSVKKGAKSRLAVTARKPKKSTGTKPGQREDLGALVAAIKENTAELKRLIDILSKQAAPPMMIPVSDTGTGSATLRHKLELDGRFLTIKQRLARALGFTVEQLSDEFPVKGMMGGGPHPGDATVSRINNEFFPDNPRLTYDMIKDWTIGHLVQKLRQTLGGT